VFPRLVAAEHRAPADRTQLSTGIAQLDALLGGGVERGASTLIQGAAGTGKSTIAGLIAFEAAKRGQRSALFLFDESVQTLLKRMKGLGIDIETPVREGLISAIQIDPAEMSPGELAHTVRHEVEEKHAVYVAIDSLNGYLHSMPDESFLVVQLHELLTYLGQQGVATALITAQLGLVGSNMRTPVDTSYLADAVVLMRYFELEGEVRQAISVVKMRSGPHERSIREFSLATGSIKVGEPLRDYTGVLTGVPQRKASA
jgi:circadian clock protein KaiC